MQRSKLVFFISGIFKAKMVTEKIVITTALSHIVIQMPSDIVVGQYSACRRFLLSKFIYLPYVKRL